MGNSCCGRLNYRSSSTVWAGGDGCAWTSDHHDSGRLRLASSIAKKQVVVVVEKQSLLGFQNKLKTCSSSKLKISSMGRDQVKINISKSQLQELLRRRADIPVDQVVLSRLMNTAAGDHNGLLFERPWRPVLQTIPELN